MSNRSLFRGTNPDFARLPSSGTARITSGSNAATSGGAGQGNANYYSPCGFLMPWQSPSDGRQPDATTLLSHLGPTLNRSFQVKPYGHKYANGLIKGPQEYNQGNFPSFNDDLWDGTFTHYYGLLSGVYYVGLGNSSDGFFGFGGIRTVQGRVGWTDQMPAANDGGPYDRRLNSLSVRVINSKVYWLVSMVDTIGFVTGCWVKVCGSGPVGIYNLVTGTTPDGTVITDWPLFNGLGNQITPPTYYMHPSTESGFNIQAIQTTRLFVAAV